MNFLDCKLLRFDLQVIFTAAVGLLINFKPGLITPRSLDFVTLGLEYVGDGGRLALTFEGTKHFKSKLDLTCTPNFSENNGAGVFYFVSQGII